MFNKELLNELKKRIVFTMPFMSPLLSIPVIETDGNPKTDGKAIYLKVLDEWNNPTSEGFRIMVDDYAHELTHILLLHTRNSKIPENKELYNYAADVIVGLFLASITTFRNTEFFDGNYYENLISELGIARDIAKIGSNKLTAEILYNILKDKFHTYTPKIAIKDSHDDWKGDEDVEYTNVDILIKQAIGDIPGDLKKKFILMPTKKWRKELFGTLSRFKEHRKPKYGSRRYGDEYIGSYKIGKSRVLVAIDASGSVSPYFKDFIDVLSSLKGIYEYHTIVFDTTIRDFYQTEPKEIAFTGGGTDVRDVMRFYIEHKNEYDLMILITDGKFYNNYELPRKPVLVVLTPDGRKDTVKNFSIIEITEVI